MFNIVLLEPEIPANTGNIGRTCLVTGSKLHLIEPLGFILNDKNLKRAGMDYFKDVDLIRYDSLNDFICKNPLLFEPYVKDFDLSTLSKDDFAYKNDLSGDKQYISSQNIENAQTEMTREERLWFATTKAQKTYCDADFKAGDYIMFGKESAGIPEELLVKYPDQCIRIPMAEEQRSLNLSNSVAVVIYEAFRQIGFEGLEKNGKLHRLEW